MARSQYGNISEAVSSGDRLESLKALADYLAEQLDNCDSMRDAASLSLRLITTLEQIESLEPKKKESPVEKRKREAAEKAKAKAAVSDE